MINNPIRISTDDRSAYYSDQFISDPSIQVFVDNDPVDLVRFADEVEGFVVCDIPDSRGFVVSQDVRLTGAVEIRGISESARIEHNTKEASL